MPEKLLHRADVGARLQQVRGEAVAQGVHGDGLANTSLGHGLFDRPLQPLFKQMMAAFST